MRDQVSEATAATSLANQSTRDALAEHETGEADNSIEAILARSRRKDLIARVGPQAIRYLPTQDPNAFLLPDTRLEPAERTWQKVFVALPWLTFAAMLAVPVLLVHGNLPYLVQRAEHDKQVAARKEGTPPTCVPSFEVLNFGQMPDVLERPFPTMLVMFHPATFAGKVFVPALRDLERLLRRAEIPVSIVALDLSASPVPPDGFLWEYPAAVSPHIQLILPRCMDGEAVWWTMTVVGRPALWLEQPAALQARARQKFLSRTWHSLMCASGCLETQCLSCCF